MKIQSLLAFCALSALLSADTTSEDPREAFWNAETEEGGAAASAKDCQFFLRLVIGGGWAPENAAYEVRYVGDVEQLSLASKTAPTAFLHVRSPSDQTKFTIEHYSLVELIRECIANEVFSLPKRSILIEDPSRVSLDGYGYWLFVKYGEHQNAVFRTNDSAIANRIYEILKRLKQTAQPGATDNPDDAQRLREDH